MRLEISVIKYMNKNYFQLGNEESSKFEYTLFTTSDLPYIKRAPWFLPMVKNDRLDLLSRISDDQQLVAIYFYLQDYRSSKDIMMQWFTDAGCSASDSIDLTELLLLARTEKDDIGFDIIEDLHILTSNTIDTISLDPIFQLMRSEQSIHWTYDSLPVSDEADYININLRNLKETAFFIEDHSCIIIGFSNNFTSLIELLVGYKPILMNHLCKLVPLYNRDITSVGRLFTENANFVDILINGGIKDVEFYGLDISGKLIKFRNSTLIHYNHPNANTIIKSIPEYEIKNLIPLYVKFIK